MLRTAIIGAYGLMLVTLGTTESVAQNQVTVATPMRSSSQRFFSNFGTSFQFVQQSDNGFLFFRNPGVGALPPFGGFDPGSATTLGFGGRSGNARWRLGLSMSQGSQRQTSSVVPSLTMTPGTIGMFNSTLQRPFVVGFIPVVGNWQLSPIEDRLRRLRWEAQTATPKSTPVEETKLARPARKPKPDDPPLILVGG